MFGTILRILLLGSLVALASSITFIDEPSLYYQAGGIDLSFTFESIRAIRILSAVVGIATILISAHQSRKACVSIWVAALAIHLGIEILSDAAGKDAENLPVTFEAFLNSVASATPQSLVNMLLVGLLLIGGRSLTKFWRNFAAANPLGLR